MEGGLRGIFQAPGGFRDDDDDNNDRMGLYRVYREETQSENAILGQGSWF